jgi:hypothetical protein
MERPPRRALGLLCAGAVLTLGMVPVGAADAAPAKPAPAASPSAPGVRGTAPRPKPKPKPVANATLPLSKGEVGPLVLDAQKRLAWLGYSVRLSSTMDAKTLTAVSAFRIKFSLGSGTTVTSRVYASLKALTRTKGVLPKGCRTGLVICIDKTQKMVRLVRNDKVVVAADARFGSEATPTVEGTFHVFSKDRDHTSSLYHTWMPLALFFSGGEAVHFSPYFKRDGYNGHSHGCVNVRDWNKQTLIFNSSPVGTRVVVYRS